MEEPQCTWRGDAGGQTWLPMPTPPGWACSPQTWQDFSLLPLLAAAPGNSMPSLGGISSQSPRVRSSPVGRARLPPTCLGAKGAAPLLPLQSSVGAGLLLIDPRLEEQLLTNPGSRSSPTSPYITLHHPTSPYITPHRCPPSPQIITPHHRPASSPHITQPRRPTSPPHITPTSPHLQQQLQEAGSMVRGSPPSWGGVGFQSLGVGREVQACEGLYLLRPSTGI